MNLVRSVPSALAVLALAASAAQAAPGDLDPAFGTGGTVSTPAGAGEARLGALTALPGGDLAATGRGYADADNPRIAIARWNGLGALRYATVLPTPAPSDDGFESAGAAIVPRGAGVLAAGRTTATRDGLFVALDGTSAYDTSFSGDGRLHDGFRDTGVAGLLRDGAGRIVAVGSRYGIGNLNWQVRRYTAAGDPDTGFSGDGVVDLPFFDGGPQDGATSVVARGGGVVVGGFASTAGGGPDEVALAAFAEDGELDPSFGTGGKARVAFAGRDARLTDLVALPGGGFLAAGTAGDDWFVAKLDGAGGLDTAFGDDGHVIVAVAGDQLAPDLAVDGAGRAVLSGAVTGGPSYVARLDAGGALDPAFGDGGLTALAGLTAEDVLVDGDRIVVGGTAGGALALVGLQGADDVPAPAPGPDAQPPAAPAPQPAAPATPIRVVAPSSRSPRTTTTRRLRVGVRFVSSRPRGGALRVRLTFSQGYRGLARVQIRRRGGARTLLGSRTVRIRSGSSLTLNVPLTRTGRAALRGRRLAVVATVALV